MYTVHVTHMHEAKHSTNMLHAKNMAHL